MASIKDYLIQFEQTVSRGVALSTIAPILGCATILFVTLFEGIAETVIIVEGETVTNFYAKNSPYISALLVIGLAILLLIPLDAYQNQKLFVSKEMKIKVVERYRNIIVVTAFTAGCFWYLFPNIARLETLTFLFSGIATILSYLRGRLDG